MSWSRVWSKAGYLNWAPEKHLQAAAACDCPQYKLKIDKNRAADKKYWGKLLQALVRSRFWLDSCFLMRRLGSDLCQVSAFLSWRLWARADTQSTGQAHHGSQISEDMKTTGVICLCVLGTFPQKVMKPVITYPVVISL